jgi:hypothetical protein
VGRQQEQPNPIQSVLPLLLTSVAGRRQSGSWEQEQESPMQTIAPALVAALCAR